VSEEGQRYPRTVFDWGFLSLFVLRLLLSLGLSGAVATGAAPAKALAGIAYPFVYALFFLTPAFVLYGTVRKHAYDAWPPRLDTGLFLLGWALDVAIVVVFNVWVR